jgi:hypothetical protein
MLRNKTISNNEMEYEDKQLLMMYVSITDDTGMLVHAAIDTKVPIDSGCIDILQATINIVTIIMYGFEYNTMGRYEFGLVHNRLMDYLFRANKYMYKPNAMTIDTRAKIEAYSDPDVAALAEMTVNGLKTRGRYYSRV